jgi:HEAT repeat protein
MEITQSDKQVVIWFLEQLHPFSELGIDGVQAKLSEFEPDVLFAIFQEILSNDKTMRKVTARAMMQVDNQRAIPLLLPLLNDSDIEMRFHLCGLLSVYGSNREVEALVPILHDPEPDVRHIAAFALGKIGDENALPALEWVVANDKGTDYEGRPIHVMASEAIQAIKERSFHGL